MREKYKAEMLNAKTRAEKDAVRDKYLKEYGFRFIGTDSLGFLYGNSYILDIKVNDVGNLLSITSLEGFRCEYSSKESFINNWEKL